MTTILSREYAVDLEIRSDGTGRTVHGILVPYGQVARVSDGGAPYDEEFAHGVFARDLQIRAGNFSGVKLLYQHDRTEPIGRATLLREDAVGLYGELQISRVARGDQALELLRDGVLDSFSVGFVPQAEERRRKVVVRTQAALREASLVTFPAYAGAAVAGVRADDSETSPDEGATDSTASERQEQSTPDQDEATATPLGGLTPAQRRERIYSWLTKGASS